MHLVNQDHPLLHQPSKLVDVTLFENDADVIKSIAVILAENIDKYQSYGISACQLGINMAIFATDTNGQMRVCVNPQVVAASVEMSQEKEGCLSFPGLHLSVRRPTGVVVRYLDINGKEVTEKLEGIEARVWLHEYDHTMGICFTDRVGKLSLSMAKKKLEKSKKRKQK